MVGRSTNRNKQYQGDISPQETHIEISALEYIGSYLGDDWRYRNDIDRVMTTVFLAHYMFRAIQPVDDIEQLKWFHLNRKFDFHSVVAPHNPLPSAVHDPS